MRKKGFTLIELLGVIVLIALISLLSFPSVLNHIKKSQETINKATKDLVINSAKNYVSNNLNYFPKAEGNVFCLTTSELLSKKYLDKGIIEENEELKNKIVRIKYSTVYKYTVVDNCEGVVIEIPEEEIKEPEYELIFEFDESTNTIKGFKEGIDESLYSNLVIPSYINGIEVKKIDSNAFTNKKLTSLTLAPTVTTIGENSFSNNSISGELDLSSVTSIGSSAFKNNKITRINLSKTITIINDYTFQNNSLATVTIPGNVKTIGKYSFSVDSGTVNFTLKTIILEEGIQKIDDYAFRNHNATTLTIPSSMNIISSGAFDGTATPPRGNLKSVIVKEGESTRSFSYHIFNGHSPKITVYVDLNKEVNKTINWNYVVNNNKNENSAIRCYGDESGSSKIICKYE